MTSNHGTLLNWEELASRTESKLRMSSTKAAVCTPFIKCAPPKTLIAATPTDEAGYWNRGNRIESPRTFLFLVTADAAHEQHPNCSYLSFIGGPNAPSKCDRSMNAA